MASRGKKARYWMLVYVEIKQAMKLKDICSFGRKAMINLESILKSRDITLSTKLHLVKAMVFPVVMYGCESWTIKKVECQRTDAFELWCWRRLLRVPWTARRSNQSIRKESSPEYSLEGLMLKRKFQSFGHLMQRTDALEKTLILGKIEDRRRRGRQRMRWCWMASPTQWHEFEQAPGAGKGQGSLVCCSLWCIKGPDMTELEQHDKKIRTWTRHSGKYWTNHLFSVIASVFCV